MSRVQQQRALQQQVVQQAMHQVSMIAENAEQQLDKAIDHFDNMSNEELAKLRQQRLQQLKEKQAMMQEWRRLGHGKYEEIADQKAWFEEAKNNKHLITHFYRGTTKFCELLDVHLQKLAPKHMETRFIKIDAEKCPFLVERLNITVMPTLILSEDNQVADRLEGFTELGNTEKFATEVLEKRLSKKGIIEYEPSSVEDPNKRTTSNAENKDGRAIYESLRAKALSSLVDNDDFSSSDDEDDAKDKKTASAGGASVGAAGAGAGAGNAVADAGTGTTKQ